MPQPGPPERQAERHPEAIGREDWEELVAGFVAGNVKWNGKRLGAEPGQPGCRAPRGADVAG